MKHPEVKHYARIAALPLYHIAPWPPEDSLILSQEAQERIAAEAAARRGPPFTPAQARAFFWCVYGFLLAVLVLAGLWRLLT